MRKPFPILCAALFAFAAAAPAHAVCVSTTSVPAAPATPVSAASAQAGASAYSRGSAAPAAPAMSAAYVNAAPAAYGWKTLSAGDSGHEVYALKLLLRNRNFDPGEAGADFDAATQKALMSFQAENGLAPTGTADAGTWEKLVSTVEWRGPGWEFGADGDAVRAAKYLLSRKYAFSSLDADGKFDIAAKAAVLLFQFNYNLGVNGVNGLDGAVGPKTWSALIRDSYKTAGYGWVIHILLQKNRGVPGELIVFDGAGGRMLEMPCLGQSMTMNPDWREAYADTPLGVFRAFVSDRPRERVEFGGYGCVELEAADVSAVTYGRDGILIHSGANKYKDRADLGLPISYRDRRARTVGGLDQTHGCVRISGADHARLYAALKNRGRGIVCISEI